MAKTLRSFFNLTILMALFLIISGLTMEGVVGSRAISCATGGNSCGGNGPGCCEGLVCVIDFPNPPLEPQEASGNPGGSCGRLHR
ncbi:hypothetical protein KSS87_010801 [Heliosperma pusillum]|nr:hypothetical protein KSS87_010801 [Heliosperma pusillum]